jgi:hypothetical protein
LTRNPSKKANKRRTCDRYYRKNAPKSAKITKILKKLYAITLLGCTNDPFGLLFVCVVVPSRKEFKMMTPRSTRIRGVVLVTAMAAVATCVMASPLTVPPMPHPKPSVALAASPLTVPPMPHPKPSVALAASPLTVPPMPPAKPSVTLAASPLTVPPMPHPKPSVTLAASPLTVPPMPHPKPSVTLAASPLTVPPMPPAKPSVTA